MWKDHVIYSFKCEELQKLDSEKKDAQLMLPHNWEKIYIKACKYSGTLRYTFDKNLFEKDVFKQAYKNLGSIEIEDQ